MLARSLPENEDGNATDPNDERRNNLGLLPLSLDSPGKSKRNEDKGEDGNQKDDAYYIQLPEEVYREPARAQKLIRTFIPSKRAIYFCSSVDDKERCDQRQTAHYMISQLTFYSLASTSFPLRSDGRFVDSG